MESLPPASARAGSHFTRIGAAGFGRILSGPVPLYVRRLHAHQPQHQIDLTPVMSFMLLYTMNKNPLSCPLGWKWVLRPGAGMRAEAGQNSQYGRARRPAAFRILDSW
jgi:hypothetical protein